MIEKYYRRIIDGVPTAVIVADQNLNAVFTNPAFRNLFLSGKVKGSLGEVTRCANNGMRCGGKDCRGCPLYNAFDDALCTNKTVNRRIYQKVRTDSVTRDVSYSLTVKPLGDGLCMGTIDDAYELEIAQELQTAKNIQQRLLPAGNWAGGKRYSYMYIPCRDIGLITSLYQLTGCIDCNHSSPMIPQREGNDQTAFLTLCTDKVFRNNRFYLPAKILPVMNEGIRLAPKRQKLSAHLHCKVAHDYYFFIIQITYVFRRMNCNMIQKATLLLLVIIKKCYNFILSIKSIPVFSVCFSCPKNNNSHLTVSRFCKRPIRFPVLARHRLHNLKHALRSHSIYHSFPRI